MSSNKHGTYQKKRAYVRKRIYIRALLAFSSKVKDSHFWCSSCLLEQGRKEKRLGALTSSLTLSSIARMTLSTCFARRSVALRQSILPAAIPAHSVSSYSTPKRFTQSLATHAKLPRSSFLPTRTYSPQASATSVPCSFRGIQSRNFSSSRPARQDDESAEAERELDDGEKNIHDILTREFQPTQLRVQDVSGR